MGKLTHLPAFYDAITDTITVTIVEDAPIILNSDGTVCSWAVLQAANKALALAGTRLPYRVRDPAEVRLAASGWDQVGNYNWWRYTAVVAVH